MSKYIDIAGNKGSSGRKRKKQIWNEGSKEECCCVEED